MPNLTVAARMPRARIRSRAALLQLLAPDRGAQVLPYGRTVVARRARLRRMLSAELLELRALRQQ